MAFYYDDENLLKDDKVQKTGKFLQEPSFKKDQKYRKRSNKVSSSLRC